MRIASLSAYSGVVLSVLCLTLCEARAAGSPGAGESAVAPSPSSAVDSSRLTLALGTEFAFGLSDARQASNSDVTIIERLDWPGLNAAGRYRFSDALALGMRVGWQFELGNRGYASSSGETGNYDRNLWQLAVEGRYQPAGRGWYAAVRGGGAAIIDGQGRESVTQWGPLGALAVGYDARIAGTFALGLELQGSVIGFPDSGAWQTYGTSSWLGFGLVGSLGI
jgi:hypothetical protein